MNKETTGIKEVVYDSYSRGFNNAIWCIKEAIKDGRSLEEAIKMSKGSLKEAVNKQKNEHQ